MRERERGRSALQPHERGKKLLLCYTFPLRIPALNRTVSSLSLSYIDPHPSINTSTHGASLWTRVWHLSQPFPREDSTYRHWCWWSVTLTCTHRMLNKLERSRKKKNVLAYKVTEVGRKRVFHSNGLWTPHLYPPPPQNGRAADTGLVQKR